MSSHRIIEILSGATVLSVLTGIVGVASAADTPSPKANVVAPAEAPDPAWFVHFGPGGLFYDSHGTMKAGGVTVPGASAHVADNYSALLELGYFFDRNFAVSFTAGIPPTAKLTGTGTVAALGKVGEAVYGPAALTVHYHYKDLGAFQPYAGLGAAYAFIFDEKDGSVTNLKVKGAPAFVLQGGFDYNLDRNWGVFVDVKKLWLAVDVNGNIGPAPATGRVTADPLVLHSGLTYRF